MVHLQDWEMAAAALTLKQALLDGTLESAAIVLTSHNPFDHPLSAKDFRLITSRSHNGRRRAHTVYQYMLPLTDAPMNTVSENFAGELTSDPLQTRYFADHLQGIFKQHGLIGIDNGLFGEAKRAYSSRACGNVAAGNPRTILARKQAKRKSMLELLGQFRDPRIL